MFYYKELDRGTIIRIVIAGKGSVGKLPKHIVEHVNCALDMSPNIGVRVLKDQYNLFEGMTFASSRDFAMKFNSILDEVLMGYHFETLNDLIQHIKTAPSAVLETILKKYSTKLDTITKLGYPVKHLAVDADDLAKIIHNGNWVDFDGTTMYLFGTEVVVA